MSPRTICVVVAVAVSALPARSPQEDPEAAFTRAAARVEALAERLDEVRADAEKLIPEMMRKCRADSEFGSTGGPLRLVGSFSGERTELRIGLLLIRCHRAMTCEADRRTVKGLALDQFPRIASDAAEARASVEHSKAILRNLKLAGDDAAIRDRTVSVAEEGMKVYQELEATVRAVSADAAASR